MRILVVDDTLGAAHLASAVLAERFGEAGHVVRVVGGIAEAQDAMRGRNYDAVVLDLKHGGLPAELHFLREMRGANYAAPVVLCAAVDEWLAEATALQLGAVPLRPAAVLRKPADAAELLGAIEALRAGQ